MFSQFSDLILYFRILKHNLTVGQFLFVSQPSREMWCNCSTLLFYDKMQVRNYLIETHVNVVVLYRSQIGPKSMPWVQSLDPDFLPVKDCVESRLTFLARCECGHQPCNSEHKNKVKKGKLQFQNKKKVSEVEKLISDTLRSLAVWKLVGFLKKFRSIYLLIKLLLSIHMYRMETIIISQVPNFSSLILSDLYKCGI